MALKMLSENVSVQQVLGTGGKKPLTGQELRNIVKASIAGYDLDDEQPEEFAKFLFLREFAIWYMNLEKLLNIDVNPFEIPQDSYELIKELVKKTPKY